MHCEHGQTGSQINVEKEVNNDDCINSYNWTSGSPNVEPNYSCDGLVACGGSTNCGTLLIGSAHDKLKNTNISETQRLQHSNGKKQPSQIGCSIDDNYNIDDKQCCALRGRKEKDLLRFSHRLLTFTNVKKDHSDIS